MNECPKYEEDRKSLFESASELSIHFNDLSNYYKFIWILSNENVTLIKELGIFLTIASEKQALIIPVMSQWVTLTYFGIRYGTL